MKIRDFIYEQRGYNWYNSHERKCGGMCWIYSSILEPVWTSLNRVWAHLNWGLSNVGRDYHLILVRPSKSMLLMVVSHYQHPLPNKLQLIIFVAQITSDPLFSPGKAAAFWAGETFTARSRCWRRPSCPTTWKTRSPWWKLLTRRGKRPGLWSTGVCSGHKKGWYHQDFHTI